MLRRAACSAHMERDWRRLGLSWRCGRVSVVHAHAARVESIPPEPKTYAMHGGATSVWTAARPWAGVAIHSVPWLSFVDSEAFIAPVDFFFVTKIVLIDGPFL
jgi:hypothetical protein